MIEFRAERPIWSDALNLYAKSTVNGEVMAVTADNIKLTKVDKGLVWPVFLEIPMNENSGQSLFDALWAVGFRPNGGESSVAHVQAMKDHLSDMRRLVFEKQ